MPIPLLVQTILSCFLRDSLRGWNSKTWKRLSASLAGLSNCFCPNGKQFLDDTLVLWKYYHPCLCLLFVTKPVTFGLIPISWEWTQLSTNPLNLPCQHHLINPYPNLHHLINPNLCSEITDPLLRNSHPNHNKWSQRRGEWYSTTPRMRIRNGCIGA